VFFEILLLGVLSAFWPTLLVIVLVAIRTPHPTRILIGFLIGGLLTCVVVGAVAVHLLQDTALVTGPDRQTLDPVVNLVCGGLALLAAYALHLYEASPERKTRLAAKRKDKHEPPEWAERFVARGAVLAFGAGIVLNIVPGVLPLVAIKDIAELQYGLAGTVVVLTIFYVLMFLFVEIPLLAYTFAPARTSAGVERFNDWVGRNAVRVFVWAIAAAGVYLVIRGLVGALT
jgi:Sap-like sulfolipid-1-addressing protein